LVLILHVLRETCCHFFESEERYEKGREKNNRTKKTVLKLVCVSSVGWPGSAGAKGFKRFHFQQENGLSSHCSNQVKDMNRFVPNGQWLVLSFLCKLLT
jgi:hypothetical protein